MLDTSLRVRTVTKGKNAGKRYLIIPFRHQTPGNNALGRDMPLDIHNKAKLLLSSSVTGRSHRPSGTGALSIKSKSPIMVPQKSYKWGDRLPAGLAPKLKDFHTTDIYAGMVKMNTSAGKAKSSQYLTFRVMMEGSPKWIVSAKPGLKIVEKIAKEIDAAAPLLISQAFKSIA